MSFLEKVKEELLNIKIKKTEHMRSEVRGMLMFGGAEYGGNLLFGTDNLVLAKRFSYFLRRTCDIDSWQKLDENAESYKFLIPDDILDKIGIKVGEKIEEMKDMETDSDCARAFVRGAFLTAGSASNPKRAYRVEIFSENEMLADKVHKLLVSLGVGAKKAKRKNLFVIYGNNSESASDILKVTEATAGVFDILEAKVTKERRNDANRAMNFDMANIERVYENSKREIDAIRLIEKRAGLDSLKPKLREAAVLRLENEAASLKELCEIYPEPIAKSTLKNRLNRLIQIAEGLQ